MERAHVRGPMRGEAAFRPGSGVWIAALGAVLLLGACAKHPVLTRAAAPAPQSTAAAAPAPEPPPVVRVPAPPPPVAQEPEPEPPPPPVATPPPPEPEPVPQVATLEAESERPKPSEFVENDALKDIYFAYDRQDLTPAAGQTLTEAATWLADHRDQIVLIEGHCDERGTVEYNLALGERRALSAKAFLVDRGIAPERILTVSYGKERPVCAEHTELCWSKNRRDHFLVKPE